VAGIMATISIFADIVSHLPRCGGCSSFRAGVDMIPTSRRAARAPLVRGDHRVAHQLTWSLLPYRRAIERDIEVVSETVG
jgi:hypothetical protein